MRKKKKVKTLKKKEQLMSTAKFCGAQRLYLSLKKRPHINKKRESHQMFIIIIIIILASDRFLLKSSIHCATPTVKWV